MSNEFDSAHHSSLITHHFVGRALRRREDPALLKGTARYVGDVEPPGTLHAAIGRSPHAHARIERVDVDAARALPEVVAVLSAADLGTANRPIPNRFPHPASATTRNTRWLATRCTTPGSPWRSW